jgi:Ran GTPase-activating protein (RanGAP) involved in mRNA processing and transport
MPTFCAALAANTSLVELLCSGHALDVAAARELAAALRSNTGLKSLSAGSASLGDDALTALLHEWENTTLKHLNLEFKGLGPAAGQALTSALSRGPTSCGIISLNLSRNELGPQGITALAAGVLACPQLTSLNLEDTEMDSTCTEALFGALAKCPLEELVVSHNPKLGASSAMHLAQALNDEALDSSTPVARMCLTKLWMEDIALGDEGFMYLLGCLSEDGRLVLPKLRDLHLGANGVTCSALDSAFADTDAGALLAMLPCLNTFRLSQNKISNIGAKVLGRALGVERTPQEEEERVENKVGMHLDLGSNAIGSNTINTTEEQLASHDGASELEAVLRSLLGAGAVSNLQLLGNPLGDAVAVAVPLALEGDEALTTLSVGGAGMSDDGLAKLLGAFHDVDRNALRVLELGGNTFGTLAEEALEELKEKNPALDVARDKKTEAAADEPNGPVPIEVVPPSGAN